MSVYFDKSSSLGQFLRVAENTLASAGVGYVGKMAIDFAKATVSGHKYAHAANLTEYAYAGGAFYLAKFVSDYVFENFVKGTDSFERSATKVIVAAKLTTFALESAKVAVSFQTAILSLPVTYFGTELAERFRAAIKPAAPAPAPAA